jgi:Zinc-binding dehydrogenase
MLIPNASGTGEAWAGLPRLAGAAVMGRGSTAVQFFVTLVVNRENLEALAALLESGDVKVVIDTLYPLNEAAQAVAHMLATVPEGRSSSPCSVGCATASATKESLRHKGVETPCELHSRRSPPTVPLGALTATALLGKPARDWVQ